MPSKPFALRRIFNQFYENKPHVAILVSLAAAALISLSGIFVRLSETGPISTAFFRFFFAIPFMWTWMMFDNVKTKEPKMPATPNDYIMLVVAGVFFALDVATWNLALTKTSVMNATLLNSLTPIFVTAFAWFVLKEKPTLYLILGIITAIVGSVILMGQSMFFGLETLVGDGLGLLSAIFYSGYIITAKNLREKFTAATVMAWTGLFTLYFLVILLALDSGPLIPHDFDGWFILIIYAIIVHIFGQGMMNYSIRHLSAGFTSVILMFGPVVAASVAWVLFDESLNSIQLLGAFVVLIGIVLSRHSSDEKITEQKETMTQT